MEDVNFLTELFCGNVVEECNKYIFYLSVAFGAGSPT